MEREKIVAAVVSAADGEITGRVRLQKVIYLLDQKGLNSQFEYEYHHYGPYSADVTSATEDAKAFGLISEEFDYRVSDGAQYSIFEAIKEPMEEAFGDLGRDGATSLLEILQKRSATILELAATINWLHRYEEIEDWRAELIRRKGAKTGGRRLEKSLELLEELGLSPPVSVEA